ncbi:malto-oligosyltrehalose trehalohydrolase [Methylovorus glucosotrophus]|uniref:Malto-oligosyltrehalose trehalohydrolase n=1 Tax=Methylovorus glucosotrophus (strain SIP3-4) TaxID=582744 RepID=C6XB32_METGS|nr:malto-oligosyltrehalose trehalohydrolase [Methylovorus glucosotrophus]ACT51802.1 malto-oligosyltrehalose trehalohydrolase [Methylovorus glucosotrophus SIP3-4]
MTNPTMMKSNPKEDVMPTSAHPWLDHASDQPSRNTFRYRLAGGAQLLSLAETEFRLWAPNARQVDLILDKGTFIPMQQEANTGWFSTQAECGAGTEYRYRAINKEGNELLVPDPYSRRQTGSVHGNSVVVDPQAYRWRHLQWKGRPWHDTVIYEAHAGVMGGFIGVRAKLAELAGMGFTAIELMPIASFPGAHNWGYDGVLQFAPHVSYGTPDELKALVDEAHALGLSIFLDVVYNHFGPDGNYLWHYAPEFFNHAYKTPWGDAIDFAEPHVQQFFVDNIYYWLEEYRFDGLRFDACHAIWNKAWLGDTIKQVREHYQGKRHVHLVAENDDNAASLLGDRFVAQWNDDGHHVLHVLLTGETEGYYSDYAKHAAEKLARCLAEGFVYQGEVSQHRQGEVRGENSQHLPLSSFVLFLQNHDQIGNRPFGERLTTLVPEPALRAAMGLVLLSPQIPLLFMGEEFGATQPFLYFTDHENPDLAAAVWEGRRREFSTFEKFTKASFAEKIPNPNDIESFNASIPRPVGSHDPDINRASEWQAWIRQLLSLRHQHIVPYLEHTRTLSAYAIGPAAVKARWRLGNGATLEILLNLGDSPVHFGEQWPEDKLAQTLLNVGNRHEALMQGTLGAYSCLVLLEGPLGADNEASPVAGESRP